MEKKNYIILNILNKMDSLQQMKWALIILTILTIFLFNLIDWNKTKLIPFLFKLIQFFFYFTKNIFNFNCVNFFSRFIKVVSMSLDA